ncbi:proton myo-inositol cotransporter-like isoform X2 [Dendronephthya gigantea]|uniref:proton myo-inositol cotransporter-like isoform X2 n=1 Tax=Dendronephthya gigantea TaxID=151771 RepID=UPI00106AAC99|nr:proton myo-inositol cotransporter-like isoform X2 [Dendronephthya gigantea]
MAAEDMFDENLERQENRLLLDNPGANDGSCEKEPYFLYISCFIVSFGFFTLGYDIGIISGSMVFITDYFSLTYLWHELLVSLATGPAILGSLFAGYSNEIVGRKRTLMASAMVFVIGTLVMACAFSKNVLLVGRILTGIAYGFTSVSSNMYIAEFAPARIRGKLICFAGITVTGSLFFAALVSGIFSGDKTNGWRYMLGLGAAPAMLLFLGVILVPESPRWLIRKGRSQDAVNVLQKLRGKENVDDEVDEIKHCHKLARKEGSTWSIFFRMMQDSNAKQALFISCGIMAIHQLSGINTVLCQE